MRLEIESGQDDNGNGIQDANETGIADVWFNFLIVMVMLLERLIHQVMGLIYFQTTKQR